MDLNLTSIQPVRECAENEVRPIFAAPTVSDHCPVS